MKEFVEAQTGLEVRSPRAVTGGRLPVALPAGRDEPGANILAAGGHGPPDKNLMGYGRPWIKFLAREAKKMQKFY
jgi:hypothetical protein